GFAFAFVRAIFLAIELDHPEICLAHDQIARVRTPRYEHGSQRVLVELGSSHGFPLCVIALVITLFSMQSFRQPRIKPFDKRRINRRDDAKAGVDLSHLSLSRRDPDIAALVSNYFRISALRTGIRIRNRECAMGVVMIKCPDTGRDIPTGIIADHESFRATPVFFARVLCPVCGSEHEWFAKEAWVCDGAPRNAEPRSERLRAFS